MGDIEEFASTRRREIGVVNLIIVRVLGVEFEESEAAGFVEEIGGGGGEEGEKSEMGCDGERRRGHGGNLFIWFCPFWEAGF